MFASGPWSIRSRCVGWYGVVTWRGNALCPWLSEDGACSDWETKTWNRKNSAVLEERALSVSHLLQPYLLIIIHFLKQTLCSKTDRHRHRLWVAIWVDKTTSKLNKNVNAAKEKGIPQMCPDREDVSVSLRVQLSEILHESGRSGRQRGEVYTQRPVRSGFGPMETLRFL